MFVLLLFFFFFSSRRRHTRCSRDWSSDVCSSDLRPALIDAKAVLSTRRPVPGVENRAPRFELTLKKVAGNVSTFVKAAGTPSQLISRRPLSAGGKFGAFKLPPSAARNLLRVSATVRLSPCARMTVKLGGGGVLLGE